MLLYLDEKEFKVLSEIQDKFTDYDPQNIYRRLEKLSEQGAVIKQQLKEVGKKILPGGCKVEYKLSERGPATRGKLIKKTMKIMQPIIQTLINQKINDREKSSSESHYEDNIQSILLKFSEEHAHTCDSETMKAYQKTLKRLLEIYF